MFLNPGRWIFVNNGEGNEKQEMEICEDEFQSNVSQKRQNVETTKRKIQEFPSIWWGKQTYTGMDTGISGKSFWSLQKRWS